MPSDDTDITDDADEQPDSSGTIDLSEHASENDPADDGGDLAPELQDAIDEAAEAGTVTPADHVEKSPDDVEAEAEPDTAASPTEAASRAADQQNEPQQEAAAADEDAAAQSQGGDAESETDGDDDPDPLTSTDLGVEVDEDGTPSLEDAWGEFRTETRDIRGIPVTFEEPADDDAIVNAFRGLDDPEDELAQLKAAAQLLVTDPEITDEVWEEKMTPTVRRQVGGAALELLGGDFTSE